MVAAVPERNRKRSVADILPVLLGAAFAAVATACPVHAAPQEAQNAPSITVGVWGAAPAFPTGPAVVASTIRQTVRLSLGGEGVSIRLSNEMGQAPLVIKAAHVALPGTQKAVLTQQVIMPLRLVAARALLFLRVASPSVMLRR